MRTRALPALLLLLALLSPAFAKDKYQKVEAVRLDRDGEKWAEKTLKKMSLEEKIGQMFMIWARAEFVNRRSPEYLRLREAMRRYHHGKELPIYITEAGIRGVLGSKLTYRTQAQFMTRLAIVLKGEGIRVFLPFYGIDYDHDGWWGFCFNLELDAKSPWSTRRISPKPSVNTLATCAGVLEGARPIRRVTSLGENVWAYVFDRQGAAILAIWSASGQKQVSIPLDKNETIEVIDIVGHSSRLVPRNRSLELLVDGSPRYLLGVTPGSLH